MGVDIFLSVSQFPISKKLNLEEKKNKKTKENCMALPTEAQSINQSINQSISLKVQPAAIVVL